MNARDALDAMRCVDLAAGIYTRVTGGAWSVATQRTRHFYSRIAGAACDELAARSAAAKDAVLNLLSPSQRRVLPYLLEGSSSLEIGLRIGRSRNTVRNHTRAIFDRLGVSTRAALVAKCAAAGVLADTPPAQEQR